ncbi:MAG: SGNH/GDSL hydrolase family protein [Ruminococcaceae bacterium]|nr:SGNH/GDSL hydrolase family protein [Oscillospiraceae bacterium]
MKKVFLIGDSIKKGYDRYVKESMSDIAEVFYHDENCRFSQYILRYLHKWKDDLKISNVDLVHWNVGHWDTLRIYNDGCLTSPENYKENLVRISERIEFLFPGAMQVFALSTPVIESGYIKDFEMRYNSDVKIYNNIAVDVLKNRGVIINDLYSLLEDKPETFHSA